MWFSVAVTLLPQTISAAVGSTVPFLKDVTGYWKLKVRRRLAGISLLPNRLSHKQRMMIEDIITKIENVKDRNLLRISEADGKGVNLFNGTTTLQLPTSTNGSNCSTNPLKKILRISIRLRLPMMAACVIHMMQWAKVISWTICSFPVKRLKIFMEGVPM